MATVLDASMLLRNGVKRIYAPGTQLDAMKADEPLGVKNLAQQLGDRFLLRYLRRPMDGPLAGTEAPTYVTPTPLTPEEAVAWLALPFPNNLPKYVVLLNPNSVTQPLPNGTTRRVFGPRWVQFGMGIEYVLESGYPDTAIVPVSADSGQFLWELQVT